MITQLQKTISVTLLALFGISVVAIAQSQFTVYKTGQFYHILSTLPGAYDLVADVMKSPADSDADKDFVDTDVAGNFEGKWKAGNTTTFVNAPGFPTFNAQTGSKDFTYHKIDSLYKAGTPITFQNSPGTGSRHVYLTKIRGGSEYVIVKFLTRIGPNNDCVCANKGITTFEYWKMPSTTTNIDEALSENVLLITNMENNISIEGKVEEVSMSDITGRTEQHFQNKFTTNLKGIVILHVKSNGKIHRKKLLIQ